MAKLTSNGLAGRIQELQDLREMHNAALQSIDETLSAIGAALGAPAPRPGPRRGRPPGTTAAVLAARKARGKRGTYPITADDLILQFIRDEGIPTTKQIKAYWTSQGRGGTADNVLSKLFREKKVKRIPIEGERGSQYSAT